MPNSHPQTLPRISTSAVLGSGDPPCSEPDPLDVLLRPAPAGLPSSRREGGVSTGRQRVRSDAGAITVLVDGRSMIIFLLLAGPALWSVGMLLRPPGTNTGIPSAAPSPSPDRPVTGRWSVSGTEDDLAWWPAAGGGSWTDLDERQLIRMLNDPHA